MIAKKKIRKGYFFLVNQRFGSLREEEEEEDEKKEEATNSD